MKFITDLGRDYQVRDTDTNAMLTLPRFAVWAVRRRHTDGVLSQVGKPLVLAVYETLEELEEEHGSEIPWHNLELKRHERTRDK